MIVGKRSVRTMFKVVCTGKNLNYGKKDEIRFVADNYINVGLKNDWFKVIEYSGSLKPYTKFYVKMQLDSVEKNIEMLILKRDLLRKRLKELKE